MAEIYRHLENAPAEKIGRINKRGYIYAIYDDGEEYLGWVDYEEGIVYAGDDDEEEMGWVEDNGDVFATYDEDEMLLGRIEEDGKLFLYGSPDNGASGDTYVGHITDLTDAIEGAAALLFFFDEETALD